MGETTTSLEAPYDAFLSYFKPSADDERTLSQRQADRDAAKYEFIATHGRDAFNRFHYSVMCDIADIRQMDIKLAEIVYDR